MRNWNHRPRTGPWNILCPSALVALVVLFAPSTAFAQEAEPSALQQIRTEVMNVLVPMFVTFIGSLGAWALHRFQQKTGIEVATAAATAWSELARRACLRGAEWARKAGKELDDGQKVPGEEILDVAADWAMEMGRIQKLPPMPRHKLEGLIEAKLFEIRKEEDASLSETKVPI